MTALSIGLDPGKRVDPASLAIVELLTTAPGSTGQTGDRWVVRDARQWALGTPHTDVVDDAGALANATGGSLIFDRTGVGETYQDLFALAYRQERLSRRAAGIILTSGQAPSDIGVPKEVLVRKFEAKLSSGRVVVAGTCSLRDVLRLQLDRFGYEFTKKGAATYEALKESDHDDLLLAVMLATYFRRYRPGYPRYVSESGETYESAEAARDAEAAAVRHVIRLTSFRS